MKAKRKEESWFIYKLCTQCLQWKIANTDYFHKWHWKFWLTSKCKDCRHSNYKDYMNTEDAKEKRRERAINNKEYRREYVKNWKYNHKDNTHKYYLKAKDTTIKEYRKNNSKVISEKQKIRYAKKQYSELHRKTNKFLDENKHLKRNICSCCWEHKRILAHHPDNNVWNEIVFVCYSCHSLIHNWFLECPKPIDLLKY